MSFEHRGFRVSTDVTPDDTGTQWHCSAKIHGTEDATRTVSLPSVDLTIPRLKIDVLMAISMVEQRAKDSIDEWHAEH